LRGRISHPH